ncbi:chromosome partition protein MukB [Thioalkalivibrio sp. HK1]|uniref:chromosome partition protein MukB n=1 Tax=Thioalkalivibrio sp. HK1 TaxID=1469245 RepID=UPI000471A765|nr:chromosome partition protein MukB [Thioalkalivibrio sp. HK1]
MSRTHVQALALVNWRGVFYERYLMDRHVTALEGSNGAGKTTVMIAAYLVLLPDMSRLRFTNLGETGATGGDKGIWGRLGEPGRPAYSVIDFSIASGRRLIAGVHLEKKSEPTVDTKPFIITDLDAAVRLQDVLLLAQGDDEVVPEIDELRENAARNGGRLQLFGSVREYFAALFEHGVTPLRLGTNEERGKFNEMLRTSMTGGISRAITSELRSFLFKEESGLADTLQRMKSNLDACRRTRTEVRQSQQLQKEIGDVFEAGQAMFAAAFFATRERAEKHARRVAEAKEAHRKANERLAQAQDRYARVCKALEEKGAYQEALKSQIDAAQERRSRLERALSAADEVTRRSEELAIASERTQKAAHERKEREETQAQCRKTRDRRREERKASSEGLIDFQQGYNDLHRRAGAYRQAQRHKHRAQRLLEIDDLAPETIADLLARTKVRLENTDRSRRDAKQRLADHDAHRQAYTAAFEALMFMGEGSMSDGTEGDATIEPDAVFDTASKRLHRFRKQEALLDRLDEIAAELERACDLAERQAKAKEQARALGLALSGTRPARIEITERLGDKEKERERLLERAREMEAQAQERRRLLDAARARQKEIEDSEPIWRELAAHARYLIDYLAEDIPDSSPDSPTESSPDAPQNALKTLSDIKAARTTVMQRLEEIKASEAELVAKQEDLRAQARELLASGGPFDPELLRLKDRLEAELLAGAFEDASIEDAAVLEARLGPLVQALVVDDPAAVMACEEIRDRPDSLHDIWLVGRDEDMSGLGAGAANGAAASARRVGQAKKAKRIEGAATPSANASPASLSPASVPAANSNPKDIIVNEVQATRITRIPTRPRLGRKAREKRAEELRTEADASDTKVDEVRKKRRRLERLADASEALLAGQALWLEGDPASMLASVRRRIAGLDKQQESHLADADRARNEARIIEPGIESLRELLAAALLLDPPDHAHRRNTLEREHEEAKKAQAEVRRCAKAAQVVQDRLHILRSPPLSPEEASNLEAELKHLSDERDRLDTAIESMEFVADNVDALGWEDAPAALEEKRSLAPVFEERDRQTKAALDEAEAAFESAENAFDDAKASWQSADGVRRAALEQHRAAQRRFDELGVADPTPAALESAREQVHRLQEEMHSVQASHNALMTDKGARDSERRQAEKECNDAKEKAAAEQRDSIPMIERWERLQATVAEKNLHPGVLASEDGEASDAPMPRRALGNLAQESDKQRALLAERLRNAHKAQDLLAKVEAFAMDGDAEGFADTVLDLWLDVRDWLRRRLPAQVAEVDDPREALLRLRDRLTDLEERLDRQEDDLRGESSDVAGAIDVQIRKARSQLSRLNQNIKGVNFGSIERIRVTFERGERMHQVLDALKKGAVQGLLFDENMPVEQALEEIFACYGGGKRNDGLQLLDYREYIELQVQVRRRSGTDWEAANPTRLSTGEAIGVGAALMMVVLTEWERDANLLRGKRSHGSLRFLFLDEANRLSQDNIGVLFNLCRALDLQLLIAAPEVAKAGGNTTYHLVRRSDGEGRETVIVSGRRARSDS